jgi:thiol-disulfide isomerase/thioredoxin
MLSEVGKPAELSILRGGRKQRVSIIPDPFPVAMPELPGPLPVGANAPAIELSGHRGDVPAITRTKQPYLLYFWATWCVPCKAALPELLAFEKAQGVPIIAVTDEDEPVIDAFLAKLSVAFPRAIASDPVRRAFLAYGVSGTPTFVLVSKERKVTAYQVGYTPKQGLALPDWTWPGRKPAE